MPSCCINQNIDVQRRLEGVIASPHLLPSHQEEVDSSDVDADAPAEVLQDFPYGGAGPEAERGAGAAGQHHAAVFGGALPHGVTIVRLRTQD